MSILSSSLTSAQEKANFACSSVKSRFFVIPCDRGITFVAIKVISEIVTYYLVPCPSFPFPFLYNFASFSLSFSSHLLSFFRPTTSFFLFSPLISEASMIWESLLQSMTSSSWKSIVTSKQSGFFLRDRSPSPKCNYRTQINLGPIYGSLQHLVET